LNDFAFQGIPNINDLCIDITPLSAFRPGFNGYYSINYQNVGTTTLNSFIIFFPDSGLSFVSSNLSPSLQTTDSIVWTLNNLIPFHNGNIIVTTKVDSNLVLGSTVSSNARIEPFLLDTNPACNFDTCLVNIQNSFDPNTIITDHDKIFQSSLINPPYIENTIYFQNTGTDTAFNIKIINPVDPTKFDVSTLELVSSSHPVSIQYKPWESNIVFSFDNILLADSGINQTESHGHIKYKFKPYSNLVVDDSLIYKAYIYFDFNNPVSTNTAYTTIISPLSTSEIQDNSSITIYPNPTNNTINLKIPSDLNIVHVSIYNLFSQQVLTANYNKLQKNNDVSIDIHSLPSGIYIILLKDSSRQFCGRFVKE